MHRPVAIAAIAGVAVSLVNGLFTLVAAANLPMWHVAWLVQPLLGLQVRPPLALLAPAPVWIVLDAVLWLAAVFYLDHCTIDQPLWAVIGGWGFLLGAAMTDAIQEAIAAAPASFIDIEHYVWPVTVIELVGGSVVILASWFRAPEKFSPLVSRWTVPLMVLVLLAGNWVHGRIGGSKEVWILITLTLFLAVFTAGERIARPRPEVDAPA